VAIAWERVVEQVERRHPNIAPFLAAGTLLGIEGNRISIGYPKTASIALARIQREETLKLVTGICTELVGQFVSVRVLELPESEPAPPSLAQLRAAKKQSEKDSLLAQARSHPLVKHTLEIFGGDLVEVRQTSPQEEAR
jgi:DNA polymerase III subunit gamma/tau